MDRGASPLPDKIGTLLQESRWLGVGAVALFLIMALWGFHRDDPGWSHSVVTQTLHNPAGRAGAWVADLMLYVFGLSAWWWVVLLGMSVWWGFHRLKSEAGADRRPLFIALGGFVFLLVASSALEALRFYSLEAELPLSPGGLLGLETSRLLAEQLGYTGSTLFLLMAMAAGWSIFSGMSWLWAFERLGFLLEALAGLAIGRVEAWRDRRI
ncbi:MAG TPA: DNA translocase FtsK 4TM domain-containing protein, partial [Azonexus sp.]